MSCCNSCMEINVFGGDFSQTQGHTFCSPPTEGEKAAFVRGHRPNFHNNRWSMYEATPAYIDQETQNQVWFDGSYFVITGNAPQNVNPPEWYTG